MAQLTENTYLAVVVKVLHYLVETSDMYQHRDIDDTWLQKSHFKQ